MASVTWDGIKFTATENGVGVLDLSDTRQNTDLMTLVCKTERGYIYRGSCGEYPYSSAVILATKVNDRIKIYAYPTEINPVGELEVDWREQNALLELQPKVFLSTAPVPCFSNYSWCLFLEGTQPQKSVEVSQVTNPESAWTYRNRTTAMVLNAVTGHIYCAEGFSCYRHLAEAKLEELRSASATDEEDEYDYSGYDEFEDCDDEYYEQYGYPDETTSPRK